MKLNDIYETQEECPPVEAFIWDMVYTIGTWDAICYEGIRKFSRSDLCQLKSLIEMQLMLKGNN